MSLLRHRILLPHRAAAMLVSTISFPPSWHKTDESHGRLIFQLFPLNFVRLFSQLFLNFLNVFSIFFFFYNFLPTQMTQDWRGRMVVLFCQQFAFTLNVTQVKCQHQNFRPQIEAEFLITFFFIYLLQLQIYPRDFVDICCCTKFLLGDLNIG